MKVITVPFDGSFWNDTLLPACEKVFRQLVVPEILTGKTSSGITDKATRHKKFKYPVLCYYPESCCQASDPCATEKQPAVFQVPASERTRQAIIKEKQISKYSEITMWTVSSANSRKRPQG